MGELLLCGLKSRGVSSDTDGLCAEQQEFHTSLTLGRSSSLAHSKNVPCFSLVLELLRKQTGIQSALDQVDVYLQPV